jgi:hypothetical protein
MTTQSLRHEPIFDVHPRTGASIEVFYTDRSLETFGRCGPGWFWWFRRRGFSAEGPATGPFATSYAAYRHALNAGYMLIAGDARRAKDRPTTSTRTQCGHADL